MCSINTEYLENSFLPNAPILHPMKTQENLWFFVVMGCKLGTVFLVCQGVLNENTGQKLANSLTYIVYYNCNMTKASQR